MAIGDKILAGGLPGAAARAIVGDVVSGQTAAGSTQATAFVLGAAITAFSTAAASTGAILPPANVGDRFEVYNGGANSLTVYPPVGGTINNLSVNTGLALATLKSGAYVCLGGGVYFSLLSG